VNAKYSTAYIIKSAMEVNKADYRNVRILGRITFSFFMVWWYGF
jgi:hypothetical protein